MKRHCKRVSLRSAQIILSRRGKTLECDSKARSIGWPSACGTPSSFIEKPRSHNRRAPLDLARLAISDCGCRRGVVLANHGWMTDALGVAGVVGRRGVPLSHTESSELRSVTRDRYLWRGLIAPSKVVENEARRYLFLRRVPKERVPKQHHATTRRLWRLGFAGV